MKYQYDIKAKPTAYNGVTFKSRLEARWAAFFDLLGWEWTYEPFDLSGWIPDFLLGDCVLVEVKPFTSFEQFERHEVVYQVESALNDLEGDQLSYEPLLVGAKLRRCYGWENISIGFLGQLCGGSKEPMQWGWGDAIIGADYCGTYDDGMPASEWDFCHSEQSFSRRIDRSVNCCGNPPQESNVEAQSMWTKAQSLSQFRIKA